MLGHDWGSVATWEYLSRPGAGDRVASFTSASGPGIAHYGGYIFDSLKRPYRPVQFGRALDRLLRLDLLVPVRGAGGRSRGVQAHDASKRQQAAHRPRSGRAAVPQRQRRRRPGQLTEDLPLARCRTADHVPRRPLRQRAGAAGRRREGSCGAAARIRRPVAMGAAAVASRHQRRPLVADVASAGAGRRRRGTGRPPRGQAREPVVVARAGRPQARGLRRHAGVCHRRGQRHRQGDRAGIRARGRRGHRQRYRRGHRQGHRRDDRRARRDCAPLRARRRPTPKPSNGSPTRCAPSTACPTSW